MAKKFNKTVNGAFSVSAEYFTNELKRKAKKARAKYRMQMTDGWRHAEKGERYQKYAIKESCFRITDTLKEEVMDGIFLNLNDRNANKPYSVQKRTLRRIVEKRQAQAVHHTLGHTQDAYAMRMERKAISRCMESIRRKQLCA